MEEERKPIGYKPRALDGGYGWIVVLGLSWLDLLELFMFVPWQALSWSMFLPMVLSTPLVSLPNRWSRFWGDAQLKQPFFSFEEFNSSNTEVSTILSLLTGLMLATGPVGDRLKLLPFVYPSPPFPRADRLGRVQSDRLQNHHNHRGRNCLRWVNIRGTKNVAIRKFIK